jgi:hypothetical protein
VGEHPGLESIRQHDRFVDAIPPSVGEHGEGAALFRAETTFPWWCRHHVPAFDLLIACGQRGLRFL